MPDPPMPRSIYPDLAWDETVAAAMPPMVTTRASIDVRRNLGNMVLVLSVLSFAALQQVSNTRTDHMNPIKMAGSSCVHLEPKIFAHSGVIDQLVD